MFPAVSPLYILTRKYFATFENFIWKLSFHLFCSFIVSFPYPWGKIFFWYLQLFGNLLSLCPLEFFRLRTWACQIQPKQNIINLSKVFFFFLLIISKERNSSETRSAEPYLFFLIQLNLIFIKHILFFLMCSTSNFPFCSSHLIFLFK